MIRDRDWRALVQHGALFFLLEKLGAVLGVPNVEIYAAMRGESIAEFQASRNAAMTYSVAGKW
jgi:gallate dioxygenase